MRPPTLRPVKKPVPKRYMRKARTNLNGNNGEFVAMFVNSTYSRTIMLRLWRAAWSPLNVTQDR